MFGGARFGGIARFSEAEFGSDARFDRVTFGNVAVFDRAKFDGVAHFVGAEFGETRFDGTEFGGGVTTADAVFANGIPRQLQGAGQVGQGHSAAGDGQ